MDSNDWNGRDIAVLVPDETQFRSTWPAEFERLRAAFEAAGLAARAQRVSGDVPAGIPALALLAWGYHLRPTEWLRRIALWEAQGRWLVNPAAALRWNTNKAYLAALHAAGLPVVPSIVVEHVGSRALQSAREHFRCDTLVVKPVVAACGFGAVVVPPGSMPAAIGPSLVQPFVRSIAAAGELSLVFFGGKYSHAVRKRAAPGEFRVQAEHGGEVRGEIPTATAIDVAQRLLRAAPPGLAYARVDLVQDDAGDYRLMELELIEPQLFLEAAREGARLLADAIRQMRLPADSRQRSRA